MPPSVTTHELGWNNGVGAPDTHMERDINQIVEVDPNEAQLLVELIETLVEEWYVTRHERTQRMKKVTAAAKSKRGGSVPKA
jgi:hypothetical protein